MWSQIGTLFRCYFAQCKNEAEFETEMDGVDYISNPLLIYCVVLRVLAHMCFFLNFSSISYFCYYFANIRV